MVTRQTVVDIILGWKGLKESDGTFKPIIDIYNTISPLPSNYVLKYTDGWAAGTVCAAYKQAGIDHIFPCECSCPRMIDKAKRMNVWIEEDGYFPEIADAIMYDWEDDNFGDNIGIPDHIGLVVYVDKPSRTFVVVEGNNDNEVKTRTLSVNSKYIRGFISPRFENLEPDNINTFSDDNPLSYEEPNTIALNTCSNESTIEYIQSAIPENTNQSVPQNQISNNVETVGRGTLSKVAAGSTMKLNNSPIYASPNAKNSSYKKTGIYYIWSVDTVNGRVRITNSLSNVGVKRQVTGWVDVNEAISKTKVASKKVVTSAKVPEYQINAVYVVQKDELQVRKGPGTTYDKITYEELTANAKKHDKHHNGCLNKGAKVTCLDIQVSGANVWIKIPSGWIPAYYNKHYNVK